MGLMVSTVMDALGQSRVKNMIDKLEARPDKLDHPLACGVFKHKVGDAYLGLNWVPPQFLEDAGTMGMLTSLGFSWLYSSNRACIRCGPSVMPLVGMGTFYLHAHGHSSWLFAWPMSEQVKLGLDMEAICDYLAKFSLTDMLAFVRKGFQVVLTARRVVWVPYGYNVAIVSLNTELEEVGHDSLSHILAMPMISDKMAMRDLTPDAARLLITSVSDILKGDDEDPIWKMLGPVYEQWLLNVADKGGDDGQEESQLGSDTVISVKSAAAGESPAISDK